MVKLEQEQTGHQRTDREAMGVAAEKLVEAKLLSKGFLVSQPTLACAYDMLCDYNGHINKLQVRSSRKPQNKCNKYKNYYRFSTAGIGGYTVLVLYVVPTDTLFFIPWGELFRYTHNINIPTEGPSKYDKYKEKYDILKETH